MKRWFLFVLAAALGAVAIGNAWPKSAPQGIPDAGQGVWWLLLAIRALGDLASIGVVGLLVHRLFVIADVRGDVGPSKSASWVEALSWLWLFGTLARIFVGLSEELGISLGATFDSTLVRSYLSQTSVGRYLLAQLILVALVVPSLSLGKRWLSTFFTFLVAAIALVLPTLTGHSAASNNHSLALGAISIHLWAIAAWVGVVLGYWLDKTEYQRTSSIAFGSAIVVAATGTINALVRFTAWSDFGSGYGRVLLFKISLFIAILYLGLQARRRSPRIGVEVSVMSAVIAVSAVLSSLQPPIPRVVEAVTAAQEFTGRAMLPAPSLVRILTTWSVDGFSFALVLVLVTAYLAGVRTLKRRGDSWPVNRTLFFLLGAATFLLASSGGIGAYAKVAFSFHMISHMMIVTLAPIGIVLGAPTTLALRTLPQGRSSSEEGLRGHLQRGLNSRIAQIFTHPIWALAVFDGSLFGLYFTGIFADLMRWHLGHALMDIHFLAVGILFFYVIVGIDPNPHRTPFLVRIVLLLGAMSIHAFFSVALMSTSQLLDGGYYALLQRPWSTDLLADQHLGGSLGWALGEIPIVLALIATFVQWVRADDREARRIDRAAARAEAAGESDELEVYNAYLRRLAERDGDH